MHGITIGICKFSEWGFLFSSLTRIWSVDECHYILLNHRIGSHEVLITLILKKLLQYVFWRHPQIFFFILLAFLLVLFWLLVLYDFWNHRFILLLDCCWSFCFYRCGSSLSSLTSVNADSNFIVTLNFLNFSVNFVNIVTYSIWLIPWDYKLTIIIMISIIRSVLEVNIHRIWLCVIWLVIHYLY